MAVSAACGPGAGAWIVIQGQLYYARLVEAQASMYSIKLYASKVPIHYLYFLPNRNQLGSPSHLYLSEVLLCHSPSPLCQGFPLEGEVVTRHQFLAVKVTGEHMGEGHHLPWSLGSHVLMISLDNSMLVYQWMYY